MLEEIKREFFEKMFADGKYLYYSWKTGDNGLLHKKIEELDMGDFVSFQEKIWAIINNKTEPPRCICGQPLGFKSITSGYRGKSCSVSCSLFDKENQAARRASSMEKYGVPHHLSSPEVIAKKVATNLERYGATTPLMNTDIRDQMKLDYFEKKGFETPFHNPEIQGQCQITFLENYGCHPRSTKEVQDKAKATNMEKYGVENPYQAQECKDKMKETNLRKRGVEFHMQDPDISERNHKHRSYEGTLPSGKVITYQGYEWVAIQILLRYFSEELIVTQRKEIPAIWYIGVDEKRHRYYPDIYIESENLIIEVKSEHTLNSERWYETNMLKRQAVLDKGLNFQFWICSHKDVIRIQL